MDQLDIHKHIDSTVLNTADGASVDDIRAIVYVNHDSKDYFFHKADERWMDFLWQNGFLDAIKRPSDGSTGVNIYISELSYLYRMSIKYPEKVTDIILDVPVSKATFNPEVISWFLRITSELPAEQSAKIVKKIHEENWPKLMGAYNDHGFDYEKIFHTLSGAKDCDSVLLLAKAVLHTKHRGELEKSNEYFIAESPFYFRELSYIKIFKYLTEIPDTHTEQALELTVTSLRKVIQLFSDPGSGLEDYPFEYYDKYLLADVDFFKLRFGDGESVSIRKDIESLAAVAKGLIYRKPEIGYKIVYGASKPDAKTISLSKSMWQLWLYTLSLNAKSYRDEVVKALSEIYSGYDFLAISSGAEYLTLLGQAFELFSDDEQREYVARGIEFFNPKKDEGTDRHSYEYKGRDVFYAIRSHLTSKEKSEIESLGIDIGTGSQPAPIIGPVTGGTVTPKSPIKYSDLEKLSVEQIVNKLKGEWSPVELHDKYSDDFSFEPINVEGVGDMIRQDIRERFTEHISKAELFFDADSLSPHYTYSFLRGVSEELNNNRDEHIKTDWSALFRLFNSIRKYDEKHDLPANDDSSYGRGYTANWATVHKSIAELIRDLLQTKNDVSIIDFDKCRDDILSVLKYLLKNKDPEPKDESIDDAKSRASSQGQDHKVSNPYIIAINSVRGVAFEAFIMLIYRDGDDLTQDVKDTYKSVLLSESTRAMYFLFGRYLATIYYRDKEWTLRYLSNMFPSEASKKHAHLAAWEGYLSNNLYRELFTEKEIQKLYVNGVTKTINDDIGREFYRDPEEGLAIHLALAYMNYNHFDLNNDLFRKFWFEGKPDKRRGYFIKFLGRKYLSEHGDIEATEGDSKRVNLLKQFWSWALAEGATAEPESSYIEFSFWIKGSVRAFGARWSARHIKATLEKSRAKPDPDYSLLQVIDELAEASPQDTFDILRMDLLEYGVRIKSERHHMLYEENWKTALEIIYQHPELKGLVKSLINNLIAEGGSKFWVLKDVLS